MIGSTSPKTYWSLLKTFLNNGEAAIRRCSTKIDVPKNFAKFTGKPLCQSLRLATLLKKETLAQVFSCEFGDIFKNTFFTEHLWTIASAKNLKIIPRIFYENKYIVKFRLETEIIDFHFSKQRTFTNNTSRILLECPQKSNESLLVVTLKINDIEKQIKNLYPNKPNGHDMLIARMQKLRVDSIYKSLKLLFKSCLETGQFPTEWEKSQCCPNF